MTFQTGNPLSGDQWREYLDWMTAQDDTPMVAGPLHDRDDDSTCSDNCWCARVAHWDDWDDAWFGPDEAMPWEDATWD